MSSNKRFKSGRISRFTGLSKSLLVASGHLAMDKIQSKFGDLSQKQEELKDFQSKIKATKEIVQQMGSLKGALMKLGQMISITEDLVLPPEITKIFKDLQRNAPSMDDRDLDEVFKSSFGKSPEEIFKSFNRSPIAAASIGQVHEGVLPGGEKVAIKVQYPKIVNAIKADFSNIEQLKKLLKLIFPAIPNIDNYLQELRRTLFLECDYINEAKNINWFREHVVPRIKGLYIPAVYSDYSSKNVLTMEFITGDTYEKTRQYSKSDRDRLGQIIYDLHMLCLYELNTVHTDPQNGNYFFTPEKVILIDFGSIRKFPREFIEKYIALIKSIENDDFKSYKKTVQEMGFMSEADNEKVLLNHFKLVCDLYLPYTKSGRYGISPQDPFQMIQNFAKTVSLKGKKTPREEFLLLDRSNLGLYTKLKFWDSEIEWLTSKHAAWDNFSKKSDST